MEQSKDNENTLALTPQLIIQIVLKRRWLLIIPMLVALIAGSALAIFLPKKYQAETLILIEGQRVPTEYVQPLVNEGLEERLNTLSQQILSRTNLEKIISQFGLYQGPDFDNMFMEDKVNALRRNISVQTSSDGRRREANAFTISYKGTDPQRVMQITNTLTSYFIEENLRVREAQALGTSNFLEEELETMRRRLEQQEQAVKTFRTQNMGILPEQLETNLRILDRLQIELTTRQESLRDARARLTALQNQPIAVESGTDSALDRPMDIHQLRAELARMQSRYTDKHPDIIKLKDQIKQLEENPPESSGPTYTANPLVLEARAEINKLQADIASIQSQIRDYEKRVELIPEREQELLTLQRDYENLKESYSNLLNRKLEAEIAVNMERQQKGEQFRIVDRARLPKRPVEPDMKKLFIGVLVAGLGLGGGLIFALEYFYKPFRSIQELQSLSGLPALAAIPVIESSRKALWKKFNWALTGVSLLATLAMLMLFSVLTLKGSDRVLEIVNRIQSSWMH